jgi:hypothetical protein
MRSAIVVLAFTTSAVFAQDPNGSDFGSELQAELAVYDAEVWLRVPFEDRERLFEQETRDAEWAQAMELSIQEKVAEFDRPLEEVIGADACVYVFMCQLEMPEVELEFLECRRTLCKMKMHWPPMTHRAVIGQLVSFLYELGIDHQGESPPIR